MLPIDSSSKYPDLNNLNMKSLKKESGEMLYSLGCRFYKGEGGAEIKKCVKLFQLAADKGNLDACEDLALLYLQGEIVPLDKAEGFRLYKKSLMQVSV